MDAYGGSDGETEIDLKHTIEEKEMLMMVYNFKSWNRNSCSN